MHPNNLTLLDFKTIVSTYLAGKCTDRSTAPPETKTGSKRKYQNQFKQNNLPPHLPKSQNIWRRCEYCYQERIDPKNYVKCKKCRIF